MSKKKKPTAKGSKTIQFPGAHVMDVSPVVLRVFDSFLEEVMEFESFEDFGEADWGSSSIEKLQEKLVQELIVANRGSGQTSVQRAMKRALPMMHFLIYLFLKVNESIASETSEKMLKSLVAYRDIEVLETVKDCRRDVGRILCSLERMPYPVNEGTARLIEYLRDNEIERWDAFADVQFWVESFFTSLGKTKIPMDLYGVTQHVRTLGLELAAKTDAYKEMAEKGRPLFSSEEAFSLFVEDKDYRYGFSDVTDEEYFEIVDAVFSSIEELANKGEIEKGKVLVHEDEVPFYCLQEIPLKDEVWIYRDAIQFLEYWAFMEARGYKLYDIDPHMLSTPTIIKEDDEGIEFISTEELSQHSLEFRGHFEAYPGRKRAFEGYEHFHLQDYMAWEDRLWRGDVTTYEGVLCRSWNEWVRAGDLSGIAELNGVKVRELSPVIDLDEMLVLDAERASQMQLERVLMSQKGEDWSKGFFGEIDEEKGIRDPFYAGSLPRSEEPVRSRLGSLCYSIWQQLVTAGTLAGLTEYFSSAYFEGRTILFDREAEAISCLVGAATDNMMHYVEIVEDLIALESTDSIDLSDTEGEYSWGNLFPHGLLFSKELVEEQIEEDTELLKNYILEEVKEETGEEYEPFSSGVPF